ncbi:MAG: hypothetical protein IPP77_08175 [Bacteroidetes bacterium]|nr:hypothetical protein [Bacteroidota bacterium]
MKPLMIRLLTFFGILVCFFASAQTCEHWGDDCNGAIFNGCMLRDIKLCVVDTPFESFTTTKKLMATLPVQEGLGRGEHRERVAAEQRNVIITSAYLFMVSREEDNDYHLILGDKRNYRKGNLFSAEVAGLPLDETHPFYHLLRELREKFEEEIGGPSSCGKPPKPYGKNLTLHPIKITIRGSLLFDSQHQHGGSGYTDGAVSLKTPTGWEIHPVTGFVLL